ncbi:hypothetical protein AB6A40_004707 [Gnathostoma spinigerum]|uniref:Ion transport domain-containing protein n=1 Tax=Gnathostoma spinigerum TaxID=75299 RepID=A0ABD6EM11_9BILA
MGNRVSSEKEGEGIKKQKVDSEDYHKLYRLVDMHGGGELLPWMRYAKNSGDHSIIDEFIESKVKEFMYNSGKGKMVSVSELVKIRNKQRNAMLSALKRKKGKGKSGPNILDDFNQEGENQGDLKKALKLLDGGGKGSKGESKYREVSWKLEERGTMGENLVGVCLLQATYLHNELARKLIVQYPKMVNDIFISEDYYGLSPLHQAIINEDPAMVNFLLHHGADINQRCYGASFYPDDQKSSRTDSLEHEYVELSLRTQYDGRMYFGEYPLSFAACLNQVDCYRLLIAKKADPNLKDTNGNTVLHLTVIHEKPEMLKLAYNTGAKLQVMNRQNLTPLTLAAHLAKKDMFNYILKLESDVVWMYGDASSHAYPLAKIDTINQESGQLNEDSALSLIVYGETKNHLDLLDGLLEDLLQAKWEAFGRRRLATSFCAFIFYYATVFTAFMCRPFSMTTQVITGGCINGTDTSLVNHGNCKMLTNWDVAVTKVNSYLSPTTQSGHNSAITTTAVDLHAISDPFDSLKEEWFTTPLCQLWQYFGHGWQQNIRLIAEPLVLVMVLFQIAAEISDIRNIGRKRWWQVLKSFPAKIAYKISFIFVIVIVPIRLACGWNANMLLLDNIFSLLIVLFTTAHFLFYSRAVKFIGPSVLMIYTILSRDLSRFIMIYAIFIIGFSQAFYVIFMACTRERAIQEHQPIKNVTNILDNPAEALLRMFIMTIGEFTVFYRELNSCRERLMQAIGKFLFLVYELVVSIMQFNLLIAMMTRTYEEISSTQKEWKRQWAQVILMLELSLKPSDRLIALLKYSRPIGTDKTKRAFVVARKITSDQMTVTEKELREQQAADLREERRALLKRRMKDINFYPGGVRCNSTNKFRPTTSYLNTPKSSIVKENTCP